MNEDMGAEVAGQHLTICGTHSWTLLNVPSYIVIRYESESGKTWHKEVRFDEMGADEESALEAELIALMYPVAEPYRLWIETPDGTKIDGNPQATPHFLDPPELVRMTVRTGGTEVVYDGRFKKPPLTHHLQIGWQPSGNARFFEIKAEFWPPAVFIFGNNEVHARPIGSLSNESMVAFCEWMDALVLRLAFFEGSEYLVTRTDQPLAHPI